MDHKLYIPKTIRIGFQKREDTFTKKLAYVIYFDDKNVLRKETSWEGWRDKKIPFIDYENKPTNGFVLNKGLQRDNYHFGSGRSVIRIHDPREFEFEITVDNLVGLLMNYDMSKKDIQGECVFAWSGKDLVLLPVNSVEYQSSQQFTEKQAKKLSTKELVKGRLYSQKKNDKPLRYLGYFEWFELAGYGYDINSTFRAKGKKHIFYDEKYNFSIPGISTFAECIDESIDYNYPTAYEKFEKSEHSSILDTIEEVTPVKKNKGSRDYYTLYRNFGTNKVECLWLNYYHGTDTTYDGKSDVRTSHSLYIYNKIGNRYEQEHSSSYHYNRHSESQKLLIKEFFENKPGKFTESEFVQKAAELGFKEIYLTKKDGVKVRIR
jgi:hypothetical protein